MGNAHPAYMTALRKLRPVVERAFQQIGSFRYEVDQRSARTEDKKELLTVLAECHAQMLVSLVKMLFNLISPNILFRNYDSWMRPRNRRKPIKQTTPAHQIINKYSIYSKEKRQENKRHYYTLEGHCKNVKITAHSVAFF